MIPKPYRKDGLAEHDYCVIEEVEEGILIKPLLETTLHSKDKGKWLDVRKKAQEKKN